MQPDLKGNEDASRPSFATRYEFLTLAQEAFARAYVGVGNGADTYKTAYPTTMRRKRCSERARELRRMP